MAAWTKTTPTSSGAGVLHPAELARYVDRATTPCLSGASPWVEAWWSLSWDLPAGTHHVGRTLPHPTCHLSLERGDTRDAVGEDPLVVTGPVTRRFDAELRGTGSVLGVKLRPGGLTALTGVPATTWTDRTLPAADVLPPDVCAALRHLDGDPDWAWTGVVEAAVVALAPAPDPLHEQVLAVVADMLADRTLVTVDQVADRHGVGPRTLQRRFRHYLGVGPKAVLARFRVQDAVEDLNAGYDGPLSDLAHRYGWYDQSHFVRDFTALVGEPPSHYRR